MKDTCKINIVILFALLLSSCSSIKDITMFSKGEDTATLFTKTSTTSEHIIKPDDNLYLSILTLDPEVNLIFNPSLGGGGIGSGTQQLYGTPTSQYINGYRVLPNGTITLPILGEITFGGLTLYEAQERLKERATEYLKEPTVQVKFLNYKVNIAGEVRIPGIYYNYEGSINIVDAISMANGITEYADIENILVKRQEENGLRTYMVNLTNNSVYSSEVFYLQPNDMVYIPPSKLKRRGISSNVYSQVLSTVSTLFVVLTIYLNNK